MTSYSQINKNFSWLIDEEIKEDELRNLPGETLAIMLEGI
jgi:hypothetical protein